MQGNSILRYVTGSVSMSLASDFGIKSTEVAVAGVLCKWSTTFFSISNIIPDKSTFYLYFIKYFNNILNMGLNENNTDARPVEDDRRQVMSTTT